MGKKINGRKRHLLVDTLGLVLMARTLQMWRCTVEIVKRTELHTFKVLPRRWVVERTFGWLNRYRRLSRDYERKAQIGEPWCTWR